VIALEVVKEKNDLLNSKKYPIADTEIEDLLQNRMLNFKATLDKELVYKNSDFVVIATPTDYDTETNNFNVKSVEAVIKDVTAINLNAVMVIQSTAPVGYMAQIR
jgi:UDPglucose 6-dehydrogenase